MQDQLKALFQRVNGIEKYNHDLTTAIEAIKVKKEKLEIDIESSREYNAKLAAKLQQITADYIHLEQSHESKKQCLLKVENEQREVYLGLLAAERAAAETNIATHVESCRYTEQMTELNKAYIQSRRDFWSKIHQLVPNPSDDDFDETDV